MCSLGAGATSVQRKQIVCHLIHTRQAPLASQLFKKTSHVSFLRNGTLLTGKSTRENPRDPENIRTLLFLIIID